MQGKFIFGQPLKRSASTRVKNGVYAWCICWYEKKVYV